ncbi:MAG: hypothetical protein RMM17_14180 [Acidobacteriota bacterium]|nr:hypothetical protein [Blastocatellia bacterium]MDW8413817.1 hypothetical protein [Acidobacteriota bacterium]
MTGQRVGRRLGVISLICLVVTIGCDKTNSASPEASSFLPRKVVFPKLPALPNLNRSLLNLQPDPKVLAEKVLRALAEGDRKSLKQLLVTEDEFCKYLWPEFPANDIPNVTCEWVWSMDEAKSMAALNELLQVRSGKQYELVAIDAGEVIEYKTFRIYKGPKLLLRRGDSLEEMALFGPILEIDGSYKLYSFYTRE